MNAMCIPVLVWEVKLKDIESLYPAIKSIPQILYGGEL